ncbi:MAG: peptidylprolyl isomerase [Clostridia bacterium]|nr:peptidylprolyl isomerase [Clostridia bacterium]
MKRILILFLALLLLPFSLLACKDEEAPPATVGDPTNFVEVEMADGAKFVIELYPDMAPKTVENFQELVSEGFYDGLTFHRVVKGFMIQGGDPNGDGISDGKEETIRGEFASNGFTQNTLKHERGVISMARTSAPDSASTQFFIMHADKEHLDGNYAAFGRVISGMETVDAIANVAVTYNDYGTEISSPVEPVVIKTMRFLESAPAA